MISETNIAWLAGIIDGEGCITIVKSGKGNKYLVPVVAIVNTNKAIITKICEILDIADISYCIRIKANGKNNIQEIALRSSKRVSQTLKLVTPYLIGKSRQAAKVLAFCESRASCYNKAYTEENFKLREEVQLLNKTEIV